MTRDRDGMEKFMTWWGESRFFGGALWRGEIADRESRAKSGVSDAQGVSLFLAGSGWAGLAGAIRLDSLVIRKGLGYPAHHFCWSWIDKDCRM